MLADLARGGLVAVADLLAEQLAVVCARLSERARNWGAIEPLVAACRDFQEKRPVSR